MLVNNGPHHGPGRAQRRQRLSPFNSETSATVLTTSNISSLTGATDFTTYGSTYNGNKVLDLSGDSNPAANSLTVDTTLNSGSGSSVFLGADANTLSLTSGALVFQGPYSETIYGGQVGASNAELDIYQLGTGTASLTIGSVISGGTGSLVLNGGGTLVLDGQSSQIGT